MADRPKEILITSAAGLEELTELIRREGRFGFDTEFVSEATFEPVLCLIQVATRDQLAVVDPLAIRDLDPFWDVVTDPAVEVIMHAAGEDMRIAKLQTGRVPERVVDVQIAAGLIGFGYPMSLGNLVAQGLGISLPGGETRTDWRKRPLTPAQVRYALDDVRHLFELAEYVNARLAEFGRSAWAEEEYTAFLKAIRDRSDEDRWRRLSGLHSLSRRGLEIARRLADWRIEEARCSNRPLRQVLRDDLLVAIAKRQPANRRDLEALRDFQRPHLLARAGEILNLIAEAQAVPPDQLPEHNERHDDGPGLAMTVNLLSATLAHCCAQQKISIGLYGTTTDLKDLVRWHASGQPDDRRPAPMRGWREQVCGQTLIDVLSGRLALRVVDPGSDVPVVIEPIAQGPAPEAESEKV